MKDAQIAELLLNGERAGIQIKGKKERNLFNRAAAMLHTIVSVAETYRNSDAAWVFRAVIRAIRKGKILFNQFSEYFRMAISRKEGDNQIKMINARYNYDERNNENDDGALEPPMTPRTETFYPFLSPKFEGKNE